MGLGTLVIEVVLPTYNGAAYLREQIASIDQQTLRPQRVLLRDDGSSDGTVELLVSLKREYGDWLELLPSDGNLGCTANVNRLLEVTQAPYVALADQDDVWLPHKLKDSLALLQQLERCRGAQTPLLVHSDLDLIDGEGTRLGSTYLRYQHLDPLRTAPEHLSITNVVTGCTVLMNRALLAAALPIPAEATMHDHWLSLVASCLGEIAWLPQPTVLYRQHRDNVIGATGVGLGYYIRRFQSFLSDPSTGVNTRAALRQAELFEQRYDHTVSALPDLMRQSRRFRIWRLATDPVLRRHLRKHGPLRTWGLRLVLCLAPTQHR